MESSVQLCYSATVEKNFLLGATVLVLRDGKILLGKRINIFGAGKWGLPGGHVDMGEKFIEAAARELMEEAGMTAERFEFANLVEKPDDEAHYVISSFVATNPQGEPKILEPEKCEEWRWFEIDEIPENTVTSHFTQIQLFREGKFFSADS